MLVGHQRCAATFSVSRLAAIVPLLLFIAGCANAQRYRGLDLSTTRPSSLITVPAAAQGGNNDCGYAAMASVALYYHVPATQLVEGGVPERFRGPRLSAEDLVKMAQSLDLRAFGYEGALDDLQQNIAKGRPVLTLLDHPPRLGNYPSLEWWADTAAWPFPIAHWVVVVGFTADDKVVFHDPRQGLVTMSKREFGLLWERRSRMSVLVVKEQS